MKTGEYTGVLDQLASLIDDWDGSEMRRYCHLANAAALLFEHFHSINWLGFYLTVCDKTALMLGPFQGKVACTDISFNRGVCGKAAREKQSIRIDDVHGFPDHIACDSDSRSELVVPLFDSHGAVVGVLDVDSPHLARFTDEDQKFLEQAARIIEKGLWS